MRLTQWPGIEKAPAAFITELIKGANKRGWDANSLLGHISSESGFDASIRNQQPGQSATGLIQVINSTAKMLGFQDAAEVGRMSHLEQLEKVIWPYYDRIARGRKLEGADFKLLGFQGNPSLIGAPDDRVLYDDPKVVALNSFADMDRDGVLTVGDVRAFWRAFSSRFPTTNYETIVRKSVKTTTPSGTPKTRSGNSGGAIVILLIAGLGGAYWYSKGGKKSKKKLAHIDIPS